MAPELKKAFGENVLQDTVGLIWTSSVNLVKNLQPGYLESLYNTCKADGGVFKRNHWTSEHTCEKPKPAIAVKEKTPQVQNITYISAPPQQIYVNPPEQVTIVNNITQVMPSLPQRRLPVKPTTAPPPPPPPPTGNTPTPTIEEKSNYVNVPIQNGLLGCLLHEPVTSQEMVLETTSDDNYAANFKLSQETDARYFLNYVLEKAGKPKVIVPGNEAEDSSAAKVGVSLIFKRGGVDSQPELTPIFGSDALQIYAEDCLARNKTYISPVVCLVPINYSVKIISGTTLNLKRPMPNIALDTIGGNNSSQNLEPPNIILNKIAAAIGVDEYPAELPASLISKDEGWLGNLIPNAPATIPNLTQLTVQLIKYLDELFGQWEIPIEVKDVDPLTPGNQPLGIKLPNLAEYAAESFLLQFRGSIDQATMLNMMTRLLMEVGQIKQQDFRAYGLLQTLVDYLGFDYSETKKDLPLSFDPTKESFQDILKEIVVKVPYSEYTEKRDFRADLIRLLEAAAITKATNTRKVPGGNNPAAMKTHIIQTIKDKAAQLEKEETKQKSDMDKFIADTEAGHPTLPGVVDPEKPYGRPYEQRPEIKKLKEDK